MTIFFKAVINLIIKINIIKIIYSIPYLLLLFDLVIMGFWGFGFLGFWSFGVLGLWGFGVLEQKK